MAGRFPQTPSSSRSTGTECELPAPCPPDGEYLALATQARNAENEYQYQFGVWRVETGTLVGTIGDGKGYFSSIAVSPDGNHLLLYVQGERTLLCRVQTGGVRVLSEGHAYEQSDALAFSPDGRMFATVERGDSIQLWTIDGKRHGLPLKHESNVTAVQFSPDGKLLATGDDFGAHFWDVAMGLPIGSVLPHTTNYAGIDHLAFSADGRRIATASVDLGIAWMISPATSVRVWSAPRPISDSPNRLGKWVETIARAKLDELGVVRRLDTDSLRQHESELKGFGGPPTGTMPWDLRIALDLAEQENWTAALWHLSRHLDKDPDEILARMLKIQCLIELGGEYDQLERTIRDTLLDGGNDALSGWWTSFLGQSLRKGDWQAAALLRLPLLKLDLETTENWNWSDVGYRVGIVLAYLGKTGEDEHMKEEYEKLCRRLIEVAQKNRRTTSCFANASLSCACSSTSSRMKQFAKMRPNSLTSQSSTWRMPEPEVGLKRLLRICTSPRGSPTIGATTTTRLATGSNNATRA